MLGAALQLPSGGNASTVSSESISRQVQALKNAFESFRKTNDEKIAALRVKVDANEKSIKQQKYCFDRDRLFWPTHNEAGEKGCVAQQDLIKPMLTPINAGEDTYSQWFGPFGATIDGCDGDPFKPYTCKPDEIKKSCQDAHHPYIRTVECKKYLTIGEFEQESESD